MRGLNFYFTPTYLVNNGLIIQWSYVNSGVTNIIFPVTLEQNPPCVLTHQINTTKTFHSIISNVTISGFILYEGQYMQEHRPPTSDNCYVCVGY